MLHRRTNTSSVGQVPLASPIRAPDAPPPKQNLAYTPLRRGSSNLYGTPSSAPRARYDLPPSPSYLGINTGAPNMPSGIAPNGYFGGSGNVYDLSEKYDDGPGYSKDEWLDRARGALDRVKRGVEDSCRLDRSWSLVWGDRELRTLVIKSTLINLLSLLLLSLSPIILSSGPSASPVAETRTKAVGLWYNILLSWPVFVVCFWINAYWAPGISRRAQTYRHQPLPSAPSPGSSSAGPTSVVAQVFVSVQRLLLISDFTLVSRVIALVPIIGKPVATLYMSIIDAFYCYDSTFNSRGWGLDKKVVYMQERASYMIGFGLLPTLLTSFGPPLVNMAIFATVFPFFVIQAILSRPPTPRNSLLPSTPSPQASLPPSPDGGQHLNLNSPFFSGATSASSIIGADGAGGRFELKVPLFFFARYALLALGWLEAALGRDRGSHRRASGLGLGRERAGKRLG